MVAGGATWRTEPACRRPHPTRGSARAEHQRKLRARRPDRALLHVLPAQHRLLVDQRGDRRRALAARPVPRARRLEAARRRDEREGVLRALADRRAHEAGRPDREARAQAVVPPVARVRAHPARRVRAGRARAQEHGAARDARAEREGGRAAADRPRAAHRRARRREGPRGAAARVARALVRRRHGPRERLVQAPRPADPLRGRGGARRRDQRRHVRGRDSGSGRTTRCARPRSRRRPGSSRPAAPPPAARPARRRSRSRPRA